MNLINPIIKSIAAIFIVSIFSTSALFLLKNAVEEKTANIYKQRSVLSLLEERDNNFLELKATYNQVEKNLPLLKSVLPDERNIGEVVENLEKLAEKTNNELILNFEPWDSAKPLKIMKSLGFTATLNGNIGTFSDFLSGLKELPHFIEIESFDASNQLGIHNSNGKLTIRAKIYIKGN